MQTKGNATLHARLAVERNKGTAKRRRAYGKSKTMHSINCVLFLFAAVQVQKPPPWDYKGLRRSEGSVLFPLQKATSTYVCPGGSAYSLPAERCCPSPCYGAPSTLTVALVTLVALRWRHKLSVAGHNGSWSWEALLAD